MNGTRGIDRKEKGEKEIKTCKDSVLFMGRLGGQDAKILPGSIAPLNQSEQQHAKPRRSNRAEQMERAEFAKLEEAGENEAELAELACKSSCSQVRILATQSVFRPEYIRHIFEQSDFDDSGELAGVKLAGIGWEGFK